MDRSSSVFPTPFQIENMLHIQLIANFDCVRHQHQVYCSKPLHFYLIESVNPRNQRFWVLINISEVIICHILYEQLLLLVCNRLDNKGFVMTEEEKASTSPTCFPCFKNSRPVHLCV